MKCNQCIVCENGKCRFFLRNTTEGCDFPSGQVRKLLRLEKEGKIKELKEYLHEIRQYNKFKKRSY